MHQNYNHRQSNHSPDYRIDYWQREKLCMSESTVLINAFTEHDIAKECETTRFENTIKSDSILDSEISSNSIMKNLLGKSGRSNKERVKTEVTEKEDLTREEKVIKECRKRKRSTSDPQSKTPLALTIVKASTLLNTNIPRTSFNASEKTAKVTEESRELDIQKALSLPDRVKALIMNMPTELKKGFNQQLNPKIHGLFWTQSPLQRTLEREPCGIG